MRAYEFLMEDEVNSIVPKLLIDLNRKLTPKDIGNYITKFANKKTALEDIIKALKSSNDALGLDNDKIEEFEKSMSVLYNELLTLGDNESIRSKTNESPEIANKILDNLTKARNFFAGAYQTLINDTKVAKEKKLNVEKYFPVIRDILHILKRLALECNNLTKEIKA